MRNTASLHKNRETARGRDQPQIIVCRLAKRTLPCGTAMVFSTGTCAEHTKPVYIILSGQWPERCRSSSTFNLRRFFQRFPSNPSRVSRLASRVAAARERRAEEEDWILGREVAAEVAVRARDARDARLANPTDGASFLLKLTGLRDAT